MQPWGSSLAVRIPNAFAEGVGIEEFACSMPAADTATVLHEG